MIPQIERIEAALKPLDALTPPDDDRFPPIDSYTDDEPIERASAPPPKAPAVPASATAKEFALTWASDYASKIAPPVCVVDELLEAGTLAVVYGEPNSGKSTFAVDLALHVARGVAWRGRRTQPGLVVYLALESAAGLRRRVYADMLRNGPAPRFADLSAAVRLLHGGHVEAVIETIKRAASEHGEAPALIVVDTLARAIAGGDENDGRDMGALVAACDYLRQETGATVVIVHHSGKDSTRGARGHSALRAAVDTEVEVTGQANPRQAKVTKQRDLESGQVFAFDLEPVEIATHPETGKPVNACVIAHRDDMPTRRADPTGKAQLTILRALRNRQAEAPSPLIWTVAELRTIGRDLGQHRNSAISAVDGLMAAGFLTPTIGGHRLADAPK